MNTVSRILMALAAAAAGLGLSVAARSEGSTLPFDARATLPPVAAEYRSTLQFGAAPGQSTIWRFWREADRIERENPAGGTGELWQRDGATTFLTRIYHTDRKGIEYRDDDLDILNALPQWQQLSLLIPSGLVKELAVAEPESRGGVPLRHFRGVVEGATWDITFRTDLMLPVEILVARGDRQQHLELLQVAGLADAPWQPRSTAGYEIIDFTDLGDRERDPFVMRLSAEEGYAHVHAH
jgi:hypothetical protein